MSEITLKNLRKSYGTNVVVKQINLKIEDKEFLVLLGPSGCGKSTLLRMIAGLETITDGQLYIGEDVVNELDPAQRNIAMVFQNYALYPHMTVEQNMGFSLENKKFSKKDIQERVEQAAKILSIDHLLERLPGQLSGGQRQRVAIGRAIVRNPKVFLMDEPLSNLDAKLRVQMRAEIAKLHDKLQITTVYVTHDQVEAMTMADRVVILEGGIVQQVGAPLEVYRRPNNKFVAGFIGSPAMNFFHVQVEKEADVCTLKSELLSIPLSEELTHKLTNYIGKEIILGIRPQEMEVATSEDKMIEGIVEVIEPFGAETYIDLNMAGSKVTARLEPTENPTKGNSFYLKAEYKSLYFFDPHTEMAVY